VIKQIYKINFYQEALYLLFDTIKRNNDQIFIFNASYLSRFPTLHVCVTVIPFKMEHGVFRLVDYSREAHLESRTVSSNADNSSRMLRRIAHGYVHIVPRVAV